MAATNANKKRANDLLLFVACICYCCWRRRGVYALKFGFTDPSKKLPQPSAPSKDSSAKCGLRTHGDVGLLVCPDPAVKPHTKKRRDEYAMRHALYGLTKQCLYHRHFRPCKKKWWMDGWLCIKISGCSQIPAHLRLCARAPAVSYRICSSSSQANEPSVSFIRACSH